MYLFPLSISPLLLLLSSLNPSPHPLTQQPQPTTTSPLSSFLFLIPPPPFTLLLHTSRPFSKKKTRARKSIIFRSWCIIIARLASILFAERNSQHRRDWLPQITSWPKPRESFSVSDIPSQRIGIFHCPTATSRNKVIDTAYGAKKILSTSPHSPLATTKVLTDPTITPARTSYRPNPSPHETSPLKLQPSIRAPALFFSNFEFRPTIDSQPSFLS